MQEYQGKNFFEDIRRNIKISYFIASLIPILLLIYLSAKYIYPEMELEFRQVGVLLILAVVISLLGLSLLTKTTNAALESLQNLYLRLDSLIEITKQFRETLYVDILLENIVNSAMKLNSAEAGSLLLFDDSDNLKFKFVVGDQSQKIKDRVVKRGEGFSGWVADTGKSLLINDVTKDKRYNPDSDKEIGFKTKSIMCVPLIHEKNIIGVIEVLNKKDDDFTKEDEDLLFSLADQAAISIAQSKAHESRQSDIIHITEILVNAQDSHSPEKKGHVRRVAKYAHLMGKTMGLAETELKNLYYASLLHDLGLLRTVVTDIKKDEPWKKEKYIQHPQIGYNMIKSIFLWKDAAKLVLYHHERYDGTGYPSGKKGEEIPLGARILFVAETFDVITSKSSYKKQLDFENAIREIEANSGSQFDPDVVKAFKDSISDSSLILE